MNRPSGRHEAAGGPTASRAPARDNLRLFGKLAVIAAVMFGFGWALIPLYNKICEVTGINSLTRTDKGAADFAKNTQVDTSRTVTVEFDANARGPWRFKAETNAIQVHPGELATVLYDVVNTHDKPVAGQVLNIAHPALSQTWSPLQGGGHAARWQSLMWAAPMYFDKSGTLQPLVLAKAEPDANFVQWTLTINPKAVFSDGSPITAEDVKGTWDLCAMPSTKHQRADLFLGGVEGFKDVTSGAKKAMSGIVVKDATTVVVTLSAPDPIFDQKIATALIPPVKISQARDANGEQKADWWHPKSKVVVSGPFMPQSMDLDQGIVTLVPNPKFFGPAPKLSKIVISSVSDASTATLMLKTGKMDVHTELITPTLIDDLGADFVSGPPLAKGQQFWFDAKKPPMDDINVRKALIMSINPVDMAKAAYPQGP